MKTIPQESMNNNQLTQQLLIEQQFAGLVSIKDEPNNYVDVSLPYLLDLYLSKNKTTLSNADLVELSRFARYLVDNSIKLENLPALRVRYSFAYDYANVPAFTPLTQLRTGRIIYDTTFKYRFVVNNIPNSNTFDVYKDSNFVITDVDVTFDFGAIEFVGWLQNNRFKTVKETLETYFQTNFTLDDLLEFYTVIVPNSTKTRLGEPFDYSFIQYLSNSLELLESLL